MYRRLSGVVGGSGSAGIVVVRRRLLRNADTGAGTGFGKHRPGKSDQQQTHSAILESTALYVVEIMQCGKGAGGISWNSSSGTVWFGG